MGAIDDQLGHLLQYLLEISLLLATTLGAVIYIAGWRAGLWGLVVAAAGIGCGTIYLKAQLCVKRENSNAKSPGNSIIIFRSFVLDSDAQGSQVISHFHTAMHGLGKSFYLLPDWCSLGS